MHTHQSDDFEDEYYDEGDPQAQRSEALQVLHTEARRTQMTDNEITKELPAMPTKIEVKVKMMIVAIDHPADPLPVNVFVVTISDGGLGEWVETFGSRSELEAFLRGVKAGLAVAQICIDLPGVPL